jgi:hypothetical protein
MKRIMAWLTVITCGILLLGSGLSLVRGGDAKGTVVEIDGLKSRTPDNWIAEKPTSRMRVAQMRVPKVGSDKEDAELIIFYFGEGQGGDVDANIQRWKSMFFPPRGKTIDEVSTVEHAKVGDVPVTTLDIQGTYKYKKAPIVPDSQAELKPGYRMLASYFGSKNGPYFLRLVGPAATVGQNKKGYESWLKNFK